MTELAPTELNGKHHSLTIYGDRMSIENPTIVIIMESTRGRELFASILLYLNNKAKRFSINTRWQTNHIGGAVQVNFGKDHRTLQYPGFEVSSDGSVITIEGADNNREKVLVYSAGLSLINEAQLPIYVGQI